MKICIADILESTVSRFPNGLAIVMEDTSYTYKELNNRVNALAWGLIDLGIEKGTLVACLLPNGVEIIETYFATAKIGAVLIPMNPNLKPAEIERLLMHSKCKVLIIDQALHQTINVTSLSVLKQMTVIWVGNNPASINYYQLIESSPKLRVKSSFNGNDPSTILYTSGTTGNPKGVVRTHANNLWSAVSMTTYNNYLPEDMELWQLPLFGIGFFTFFLPNVISGSTVYLPKGFDPENIFQTIETYSITRMYLVPSLWRVLSNHPKVQYFNLSSLRVAMIGSAPVSLETKKAISKMFPSAEIYEFWGMTEGGLISILPKEASDRPGSIGRPLPFHEATLIDEHGMEVVTGNIGEIAIRGLAIITSYFNNQEKEYSPFTKDGWLRTGDLARRDNEGFFYLSGRKSDMIISGENKIYPSEIERVIESHPKVHEAAVFAMEDPVLGEVPVAAVVLKDGDLISEQDILDYLTLYLANYKQPKHVFFPAKLPAIAPGKIVKALLKSDFLHAITGQ